MDLLPGLCPWTPVGNFHHHTPWRTPTFPNPGLIIIEWRALDWTWPSPGLVRHIYTFGISCHRTTFPLYIFATKASIDNRKKNLLSSNTSSTCPVNMVNFGPLTAEIGSGVWGNPTNFNGFCALAALLHGI